MLIFRTAFEAMASQCELVLAAADEAQARLLAQFAVDEVKRIEQKYSRYRTDSIVSRINAQAGHDWVECDEETISLLDYAEKLFQLSDGLSNPVRYIFTTNRRSILRSFTFLLMSL